MTPRRSLARRGVWVRTFMPFSAGVVHEAGVPLRPSISTRHRRQEPNELRLSVAHSFGTLVPISAAARMTEVPAGTVTLSPSISSVTITSVFRAGVPYSVSLISIWLTPDLLSCAGRLARRPILSSGAEILGEVLQCALDGEGGEPAQGAQRSIHHRLAQVVDDREVQRAILAGD